MKQSYILPAGLRNFFITLRSIAYGIKAVLCLVCLLQVFQTMFKPTKLIQHEIILIPLAKLQNVLINS